MISMIDVLIPNILPIIGRYKSKYNRGQIKNTAKKNNVVKSGMNINIQFVIIMINNV